MSLSEAAGSKRTPRCAGKGGGSALAAEADALAACLDRLLRVRQGVAGAPDAASAACSEAGRGQQTILGPPGHATDLYVMLAAMIFATPDPYTTDMAVIPHSHGVPSATKLKSASSRGFGSAAPGPRKEHGGEALCEARGKLLEEKRELGCSMEELRAMMRVLQEGGEVTTLRGRAHEALRVAAEARLAASHDELAKAQGQLRRSALQREEHREARERLREELSQCLANFQAVLSAEEEAQAAVRQEVGQLRAVTQDLEERLRAKVLETAELNEAGRGAAERLAAAEREWQTSREEYNYVYIYIYIYI